MKENQVTLSSGRKIWIYDDVLDHASRELIYLRLKGSYFVAETADNSIIEQRADVSLASVYTPDDCKYVGIFEKLPEEIKEKHDLNYDKMLSTLVNMGLFSDKYHIHSDTNPKMTDNAKTLLYYGNLRWDIEWGGDTVFLDDQCKQIEFYSQYIPGRVVIFDSRIPHLIRPATILAPSYRFTYAMRFA